ncbi:MAG: hypothetical protein H6659_16235 [Ardenticatenaceae bacterium]|nr:hypothetical protein [Ardenticatenaceae bacterium]
MSQTFQIPIPPAGQSPLVFPNRCVCCGAPKQAESTLLINRLVTRGEQQVPVSLTYQVPHCERCARSTKAVFLAGCIPFVLGVLLVGGLTFFAVTYGAIIWRLDEYGQPNNTNSLVLGAAAGLVAGLVAGFLFEAAARVLLLPLFGKALFRAPLLAAQFFTDADYVAGLTARPDRAALLLQLTFANDEIGREFRTLNNY